MTTLTSSNVQSNGVTIQRVARIGLLTIAAAISVNVVIWLLARVVLNPDPGFLPLATVFPVIFLTLLGVLGALAAYAIIAPFLQRPLQLFRVVAVIALLLSAIPSIGLLVNEVMSGSALMIGDALLTGVSATTVGALLLMHLATWAVCASLLPQLSRAADQYHDLLGAVAKNF